jgi:hypothetical protein
VEREEGDGRGCRSRNGGCRSPGRAQRRGHRRDRRRSCTGGTIRCARAFGAPRVARGAGKAAATATASIEKETMASDDEAPAPRATRGAPKAEADTGVAAAAGPMRESAPGGGGAGGGGATASIGSPAPKVMARSVDPIAGALAQKNDALKACVATHGAKEAVTLTIDVTNGKATIKLTSKAAVSAALDKCIKGVVGAISFTGSGKATRVIAP